MKKFILPAFAALALTACGGERTEDTAAADTAADTTMVEPMAADTGMATTDPMATDTGAADGTTTTTGSTTTTGGTTATPTPGTTNQ